MNKTIPHKSLYLRFLRAVILLFDARLSLFPLSLLAFNITPAFGIEEPPPAEVLVTMIPVGELRWPVGSTVTFSVSAQTNFPSPGISAIWWEEKSREGDEWRPIEGSMVRNPNLLPGGSYCVPCFFSATFTITSIPLSFNGRRIRAAASAAGMQGGSHTGYSREAILRVYDRPPAVRLDATALNEAVRLFWTPIPPDQRHGNPSYVLYRSVDGPSGPFIRHASPGQATFDDRNLSNGTSYCYYVIATNGAGESGPSNIACATPGSAPPPPSGVRAWSLENAFGADWDEHPSAITYTLYYTREPDQIQPIGLWNRISDATNPQIVSQLEANRVYYVRVAARTTAGVESDPSDPVSVVPRSEQQPPEPPLAPSFVLTGVKDGSIRFCFPAVSRNGAPVDEITFTQPSNGLVAETPVAREPLCHTLSGNGQYLGEDSFTYRARSGQVWSDFASVNLTFHETLKIRTESGYLGQWANGFIWMQFTAEGGAPPYRWRTRNGVPLPPNLALNAQTGVLEGRVSRLSTQFLPIEAVDGNGVAATGSFMLIGVRSDLRITTDLLPTATVGESYNGRITATGGRTPYTWSVLNGPLPPSLTLTPGSPSANITGVPEQAGAPTVIARVGGAGPTPNDLLTFNATILQMQINSIPYRILTTTDEVHPALIHTDYLPPVQFRVQGDTGNSRWEVVHPRRLHSGITLSPTGRLSGRPTEGGRRVVRIQASEGNNSDWKDYLLDIVVPPLRIATTQDDLPTIIAGEQYGPVQFRANGGVDAPYEWTMLAPYVPPHVVQFSTGGVLSGRPSEGGTFPLHVRVKDSANNTSTGTFSVRIIPRLQFETGTLPDGTVNQPYSGSTPVRGGVPPYRWSAIGLPPQLQISQAGIISGTVASSQTFRFTLEVQDSSVSNPQTISREFSLRFSDPLNIVTPSPLEALWGRPVSIPFQARGGAGPYTWSAVGLLRDLYMSPNGVLNGVPIFLESFTFTVQVRDSSVPPRSATREYRMSVRRPLHITTTQIPEANVNQPYNFTLRADYGTQPYTWSADTSLPPGLQISPSGVLSGLPTTPTSYFSIVVRVRDASTPETQTATAGYAMRVNGEPRIILTTQNEVHPGYRYYPYEPEVQFRAQGLGNNVEWRIVEVNGAPGNDLPLGMEFTTGGRLHGHPESLNSPGREGRGGWYQMKIRATGPYGSAEGIFTLNIHCTPPPPGPGDLQITSPNVIPDSLINQPYSYTFQASGGTPPYRFSIGGFENHLWFQMNPNGVYSGTPIEHPVTPTIYAHGVFVFDSSNPPKRAFKDFVHRINRPNVSPLRIDHHALRDACDELPYSGGTGSPPPIDLIEVTGGAPPYTWGFQRRTLSNFDLFAIGEAPWHWHRARIDSVFPSILYSGHNFVDVWVQDSSVPPKRVSKPFSIFVHGRRQPPREGPLDLDIRPPAGTTFFGTRGQYFASPPISPVGGTRPYYWTIVDVSPRGPVQYWLSDIGGCPTPPCGGSGTLQANFVHIHSNAPMPLTGFNDRLLLRLTDSSNPPKNTFAHFYIREHGAGGGEGGGPGGGCRMLGEQMYINLGPNYASISSIEIRTVQQMRVRTLQTDGRQAVLWDGRNDQGGRVQYGHYLVFPNQGPAFAIVYPCR